MNRGGSRAPSAAWRVFRAPLLLALLTAAGLATALVGEGGWRWFSWCAMAAPVLLCLWYPARSAWRKAG